MGDMSMETFQMILRQISQDGKCQVPAIKLTHRGEPLLNKRISEMVSMAKGAGALDVILNTNATLLSEETAAALFRAGLDKLLISIDSPEKMLYEKLRVGASFDAVTRNIRNAVAVRNKLDAWGTIIRTGMVLTKETAPHKNDFLTLFQDIADIVSFNKVHEEVKVNSDGTFMLSDGSVRNVKDKKFADSQLWQRFTINWNGDAEICCENYKQEYKLGNIMEKSVEEIWNGYQFRKVREIHLKNEWWKIPQCKKCTIPYIKEGN
jgi:radical SAM protein with 4Fe4S-binding SPASM domain